MTIESLPDLKPSAPDVGAFADREFLEVMWKHTAGNADEVSTHASDAGAIVLVEGDAEIRMVGPQNLVDYRSPLGDPKDLLPTALEGVGADTRVRFDSLPQEAVEAVVPGLDASGVAHSISVHESTAVLSLPATFDDYMSNIGKKERHETRRKIRRFGEAQGEPRIVTYTEPGPALLRFFRLHRLADGTKSAFMTPAMTRLFTDLVALPGWQVDALYGDGPRSLAVTVSFVDASGYYLYNSAFDPAARESSPGVVLLNTLIRDAIGGGRRVFDFLKGDEVYKYRMGAEARPLYQIEGVT